MPNWLIYAVVGIIAIVLGGHDLLTGTGSLVFGTHATSVYGLPKIRYTGIAAYMEGAVFIAVGIFCLYRVWRHLMSDSDAE